MCFDVLILSMLQEISYATVLVYLGSSNTISNFFLNSVPYDNFVIEISRLSLVRRMSFPRNRINFTVVLHEVEV